MSRKGLASWLFPVPEMQSDSSLKDQILFELPFLFSEGGFHIVSTDASPWFGDGSVVMSSSHVRLRFVRERGTLSLEIGPSDDKEAWWDLALVLEVITGGSPTFDITLQGIGAQLRQNLAVLNTALGQDLRKTRQEIERLLADRHPAPPQAGLHDGGVCGSIPTRPIWLLLRVVMWVALAFVTWRVFSR